MQIFGREVRFMFTVEARFEINALSPDLNDDERLVETAIIMNKAYNERQRFLNKEYHAKEPLEKEEIMKMTPGEWSALCDELAAATTEGMHTTVEVENKKKEGNEV